MTEERKIQSNGHKRRGLARAAAGGLLWGVFLSAAPVVEVVILGAVLWIPLLGLIEWRRAKRYGFLPGALVRITIAGAIVVGASYAPLKWQDRYEVGPFAESEMSIGQLAEVLQRDSLSIHFPESRLDDRIHLPSERLSFKQLAREIERQARLTLRIGYCGNMASVLWGAHPITISFDALPERNAQANSALAADAPEDARG